jgi:pyruvate kinase
VRKVKIVCTIGPASSKYNVLRSLAEFGMSVARLNFSHGDYESHGANLDLVRLAEEELGRPIATMLDTKGPEIRTGKLEGGGPVFLEGGQTFVLTTDECSGNAERVSISYKDLPKEVSPGQEIFIDDGSIHLRVVEISKNDVVCTVIVGGELGEKKGVNVPGAHLSVPALTTKDKEDIRWGIERNMDYVAVSFVRTRDDIMNVRKTMEELGGSMKVIAKIETKESVNNLEEIVQVVDGVMVARGDLGVEMPTEDVPIVQKRIIDLSRAEGKPVIVATQMLDSMIRNPRPTRAEASDVANAVLDGADAVMLSGETASGKYPAEAVKTMSTIVLRAEQEMRLWQRPATVPIRTSTVPDAVSHASVSIAEGMKAKAIISLTSSGSTARMVSKYRPLCPVIGITPSSRTWRELSLVWGVYPIYKEDSSSVDEAVESSFSAALDEGLIEEGDMVVVTAGVPVGIPGTTNMVQVHTVGRILLKGMSLIRRNATGPVRLVTTVEEAKKKVCPGDIIVVKEGVKSYMPVFKKAAAIIAEEGGLASYAAMAALELGIPCVVGATGASSLLKDGMVVTVDGYRGIIYKGEVKLH